MKNKVMGAIILASLASPVLMAGDFNGQAVELDATQLDAITAGTAAFASSYAFTSNEGVGAASVAATYNAAGVVPGAVYAVSAAVGEDTGTDVGADAPGYTFFGGTIGGGNIEVKFIIGGAL